MNYRIFLLFFVSVVLGITNLIGQDITEQKSFRLDAVDLENGFYDVCFITNETIFGEKETIKLNLVIPNEIFLSKERKHPAWSKIESLLEHMVMLEKSNIRDKNMPPVVFSKIQSDLKDEIVKKAIVVMAHNVTLEEFIKKNGIIIDKTAM